MGTKYKKFSTTSFLVSSYGGTSSFPHAAVASTEGGSDAEEGSDEDSEARDSSASDEDGDVVTRGGDRQKKGKKERERNDDDDDDDGGEEGSTSSSAAVGSAALSDDDPHPFAAEVGDHAETPAAAYEHIAPILTRLAFKLDKKPEEVRIYDPFFCQGAVRRHLAAQGFTNVYNKNEDFYAVAAAKRCPEFDVIVTNPPFSGDHIERIFRFARRSGKPWFLLIPQYCAKQAFYLEWFFNRGKDECRPYHLAPSKDAYVFVAPDRADVRAVRTATDAEEAAATAAAAAAALAGAKDNVHRTAVSIPVAASASIHSLSGGAGDASGRDASLGGQTSGVESVESGDHADNKDTGSGGGFEVRAGSFQCVWFFNLGKRLQQPTVDWWRRNHEVGCDVGSKRVEVCRSGSTWVRDTRVTITIPGRG